MQAQARRELLAPAAVKAPAPALSLHASSSNKDLRGQDDAQLLAAAKWEHAETTGAARRCLKVADETTRVAEATLDSLYRQGEQLEAAAHGVEQIDENVQHAGRILSFMARCCCFRGAAADADQHLERHYKQEVSRRQMDGQLAAVDAAAITAGKRQVVHAAIASRLAGEGSSGDATPTSRTAAAAAAAAEEEPWDGLIAAVPGPLGAERPAHRARVCMGYGLAPPDQAALQAETAAQDCYLDAVVTAVDALRSMGLAMGVEMDEQAGKIEALQQRAEDAGLGLRGVAKSAAKLVGRAPAERRGASSAGGWQAGQDAASAAVARATLASAPAALRYSSKALR